VHVLGSDTATNSGVLNNLKSSKIVIKFTALPDTGHYLWMDKYHTSPSLVALLRHHGVNVAKGTACTCNTSLVL
jgi:hypothetical protein